MKGRLHSDHYPHLIHVPPISHKEVDPERRIEMISDYAAAITRIVIQQQAG